jgi:electron transfer flavoprotein beta subunit
MKIVVPVKLIPDLVDELTIDASGAALDSTWLRLIINEFDDHAIEQAILLKERGGGHVTVISPNVEGVDDMLFTTAAKGADKLIKLNGNFDGGVNNHALARGLVPLIQELQPDLVLIGVQAHNDMDGSLGALLAEYLHMPYVGYVSGVSMNANQGIQASEQPPRYVAISKVRQMMKTVSIDEFEIPAVDLHGGATISKLYQPEVTEKATMISGDIDITASKLIDIFKELGVL